MLRAVIDAIRRNHALEHGTVMILLGRLGPSMRLVGRAVPDGFYVYGRVPTDVLAECAHEALRRFQAGEAGLAVTPLCGTNIAVGGVLAAVASMLAMGRRPSLDRVPNACSAAMLGLLAAQPVGRWVQQFLTTRADLEDVAIVGVRRGVGGLVHKVETVQRAPGAPHAAGGRAESLRAVGGDPRLEPRAPVAQPDRATDF
jgi:hypothetical protein